MDSGSRSSGGASFDDDDDRLAAWREVSSTLKGTQFRSIPLGSTRNFALASAWLRRRWKAAVFAVSPLEKTPSRRPVAKPSPSRRPAAKPQSRQALAAPRRPAAKP
ncbi:hypothetical protein GUJ93_ZPchr0001g30082 [Zizania palustris]|uniref:Uncharacterized protein n=1 Tax=Zizania palustris TaxID=103762 RepID=A0A8J5RN53_ZIZPA|nr:hypothetical protein GUJ93_ZPchr0001g30082 [Zizania palustris]